MSGAAPYLGALSGVTLAFLLLESLPLIVRRRFPLAVLGVIAGASILHLALLPAGQSPRPASAFSSRSTPSASGSTAGRR